MAGISYESTQYLIEAGHRRIAFISTLRTDAAYGDGARLDSSQISDRLDGMRRAFEDAGLPTPETSCGSMPAMPSLSEHHPGGPPAA